MSCIVNYSDSSDEGEQVKDVALRGEQASSGLSRKVSLSESCHNQNCDHVPPLKRQKIITEEPKQHNDNVHCTKLPSKNTKEQLSLPSSIQSMFASKGFQQWEDDPSQHGNRMRSFPHVEGNWATHVFIPVKKDEKLIQFVRQLLQLFEPLEFEILPEFHMSLSRTVVIRHHWIDPLVDCLRDSLSSRESCVGDLDDVKFYSNDEKSRTFLCLEVAKEDTHFTQYVADVDKCFAEFKLAKYYEDPSFHISIAWCLGNVCHSVSEEKLEKAKEMLGSFCAANPEQSVVFAHNICCRSGNKSFVIPLIV